MKNFDLRMIQRAAKMCAKGFIPKEQQRVAAILTDSRGNILSTGINSYSKTHTLQAYYAEKTKREDRIYLHAEISALVKNRSNKTPSTIYIVRLYRDRSTYALAKPCDLCKTAIEEAGIKRIVYTTHLGVREE